MQLQNMMQDTCRHIQDHAHAAIKGAVSVGKCHRLCSARAFLAFRPFRLQPKLGERPACESMLCNADAVHSSV